VEFFSGVSPAGPGHEKKTL